jgi:urease accessory protein
LKISALRFPLLVSLSLFCPLVLAHPGHGSAVTDGILHPLTGLDHLLAMFGIGLWSAQQSGRVRWLIPAAFVALMALSAWIATLGHGPAFVDSGIAASVLLIGLLISFSARTSSFAGVAIVSVFAVFHGFGHGAEMPHAISGWLYGGGFLATTILLHAIGFLSGTALNKTHKLMRISGAGIAVCGGFMVLQGLH